ncbi:MAG: glycosyltransferase family 2 protein [Lachnospiraceae bacterium]|nr:glycosyltransferase family 2 protein [Lachnospiraceae bacterium]
MEPLVSILCVTFNHKDYIRRALDSFLAQKTDFPFEIIIHDDASTDGTSDILKEYQEKYPEIVIPYIQTENQYSKPDYHSMYDFIFPIARGKYFAHCDGDDYFSDPLKLQRQVDYLEAHPDCSIVTHRALWHVEGTDGSGDFCYPAEESERDFSTREIFVDGAGLFATNSFVLRADVNRNVPEAFYVRGVGDYTLLLYAATQGRCHYLPEVMSVHNDGVPGSWTVNNMSTPEKKIRQDNIVIDMLKTVDAYYGGKYHAEAAEAIEKRERLRDDFHFKALWEQRKKKEAAALYPERRKRLRRDRLREKLPGLAGLYDRLKGR